MTSFKLLVLVSSLALVASSFAQQREDPSPPSSSAGAHKPSGPASGHAAGAPERSAEAPKRILEITRSPKPDCDVKPVMTDEEIARCRKVSKR